jgi:hypothetical protein
MCTCRYSYPGCCYETREPYLGSKESKDNLLKTNISLSLHLLETRFKELDAGNTDNKAFLSMLGHALYDLAGDVSDLAEGNA